MKCALELQQTNKLNSIQQSSSWEADSSSASHKSLRILCNPKVHYRAHNSPTLVSILNNINGIHTPRPFLEHPFYYFLPIYAFVFHAVRSFQICHTTLHTPISSMCQVPNLLHSSWFDHSPVPRDDTFSSLPSASPPSPRPKVSPQHHILQHVQPLRPTV